MKNPNRKNEIIAEKQVRAIKRLNLWQAALEAARAEHNEKVAQGLRGCPMRIANIQQKLENAATIHKIITTGKLD